jgi:hypothetical protein
MEAPMRVGLVLLATTLLGCTDRTAGTLNGVWRADNQVVGSSIVLSIVERGTAISGSGTYQFEAGRSGTLQVAGSYQQSEVRLTLSYDFGQSGNYVGRVEGGTHMSGTMAWSTGLQNSLTFSRIPTVP